MACFSRLALLLAAGTAAVLQAAEDQCKRADVPASSLLQSAGLLRKHRLDNKSPSKKLKDDEVEGDEEDEEGEEEDDTEGGEGASSIPSDTSSDSQEDPPTVIQPNGSLSECGCKGNPHSGRGGQQPGLKCLPWIGDKNDSEVTLSEWSDGEKCEFIGEPSCGESPCNAEPTGFNWIFSTDRASKAKLQYTGAYQFDGKHFRRIDSSSFNCDGRFGAQDLRPQALDEQLEAGEMWLPPYPGGAAEWVAGFTPYSTMERYKGGKRIVAMGSPAFMIVAKFVGELSHMAWYVLAQRTLNNGAFCRSPRASGNCWHCGYGEIDILEGNYCEPNLCMTLSNGRVPGRGSCLFGQTRVMPTYRPQDGESPLVVAVFDKPGVTVYLNPVWEGLTPKTAAPTLPARPRRAKRVTKAPGPTLGEHGMWSQFKDTKQLRETG